MQAVVTFACKGPAGSSGVDEDRAPRGESNPNAASDTAHTLTLNMDRHPIYCIVEIAAGIPDGSVGLDSSLAVSCTRSNRIVARFRRFPFQTPHPPRVARFVCSELGGLPRSAS